MFLGITPGGVPTLWRPSSGGRGCAEVLSIVSSQYRCKASPTLRNTLPSKRPVLRISPSGCFWIANVLIVVSSPSKAATGAGSGAGDTGWSGVFGAGEAPVTAGFVALQTA